MFDIFLPAVSAFWLGIMTSISPCPLATNILAISFIDRRIDKPGVVGLSGLLYILGRIFTYTLIGFLLVSTILSVPNVSYFLQKYMNKILGPILILVGMILFRLIRFKIPGGKMKEKMQEKAETSGIWGAGALGIVFALSFCPISAAFFFGSLIPLSIKHNSTFLLPALYGLGTGLPVFILALTMAFGANFIGKTFNKFNKFERWIRYATATIFIIAGFYYCFKYIFRVFLLTG